MDDKRPSRFVLSGSSDKFAMAAQEIRHSVSMWVAAAGGSNFAILLQ